MNIQVLGPTELNLSQFDIEEFHINLENDMTRFSAIAMFVTSLAKCTFAVMGIYAERMEITTKNIVTHLKWDLIENPTRINQINLDIYWPELPEKRVASVERASHKCTLSTTIKECIKIKTVVFNTVPD